jgi:hypothetical protein
MVLRKGSWPRALAGHPPSARLLRCLLMTHPPLLICLFSLSWEGRDLDSIVGAHGYLLPLHPQCDSKSKGSWYVVFKRQ